MKKKFTLKEHQWIAVGLILLGAAVLLLSACFQNPIIPALIGFALMAYGIWYRFKHVKCPHCGSSLHNCRDIPAHCPDCGESLY